MNDAINSEWVFFWNSKSKTVHRYMKVGGGLLTVENDNVDDSKHLAEISEAEATTRIISGHGCGHCCGSDAASGLASQGDQRASEEPKGEVE